MLVLTYVSGPDISLFGQTLGSGVSPSVGSPSINIGLGQVLKGYLEQGRSTNPPSKDSDSYISLKVLLAPPVSSAPYTKPGANLPEGLGPAGPTVATAAINGVAYGAGGASLAALLAAQVDG
jgi:hypothetical protein